MNIRTLICFKTVAELKHYTKAANQLYLTQSALSKTIRNLEQEIKVSLFEKHGRNVTLTRAGEVFYDHVIRALGELNAGVTEAQSQEEREKQSIVLSVVFSDYATQLPEKLLAFRRQHPNCQYSIEYKYTSAIMRDLFSESCDMGICGDFPSDGKYADVARHLLDREPVAIVVSKHHRFALRDCVEVEELRDEPFIIWNRSGLGTNKLILDLCKAQGFEPNFFMEAYSNLGVINAVATGMGIAVLPRSEDLGHANIKFVQLKTQTPPTRNVYLVWKKDRRLSPVASSFRDMLVSWDFQRTQQQRATEYSGIFC